jgi:hypothetical protein
VKVTGTTKVGVEFLLNAMMPRVSMNKDKLPKGDSIKNIEIF